MRRRLGIGHKTGYRWRAENGGLRPDYLPESSRSGRYLSLLERRRIAALRERGLTIREIAGLLGRPPSTVSRELRRNSRPHDYGRYDADLAHHRCRERAGRPRRAKLATDPKLKAEVQSKLDLEWSPEQIASHLRTRWPDRPERHLCHETIYRALYQGARGGLIIELRERLGDWEGDVVVGVRSQSAVSTLADAPAISGSSRCPRDTRPATCAMP
ncbi:helix-turn-helix domain-containing protein [Streptomyces mirabilis]|uniref:helix-turn-helix domain-containing protein n=1 Tax=Streptomyces mirabilis TaxID=68239 RepID=UPI0033306BD0